MLIIQPIGGLCNRMRAINSALVLAKKQNKKLKVIWNINAELGCPFEELFETTDAFTVLNIRSKWNPVKLFYQFTRRRIGNDDIRSNRDASGLTEEFQKTLDCPLYIATEEHFFECHDYSSFVPTAEISERIKRLTSSYGSHNVGVHIRRTDNKPAIGKSSTQAFVDSMQKEIDLFPDTRFYLATDDLSEEENLRRLFPDRIISNETRDLSRDSITGIKDALLDLMCLARTDKIIGSYFSSFTDIAADWNGIPKCVAGEDE
ncbi:MAG: hypothetical protein IJ429_01725 [Lachnospiraceae bacterium]|nr:hypothetical protein [Lachnospiraceae bacterium]